MFGFGFFNQPKTAIWPSFWSQPLEGSFSVVSGILKLYMIKQFVISKLPPSYQDGNKDTDLLENGLEDMGRGWGEM